MSSAIQNCNALPTMHLYPYETAAQASDDILCHSRHINHCSTVGPNQQAMPFVIGVPVRCAHAQGGPFFYAHATGYISWSSSKRHFLSTSSSSSVKTISMSGPPG